MKIFFILIGVLLLAKDGQSLPVKVLAISSPSSFSPPPFSLKQVEKLMGRRLTLKEKIVAKLVTWKLSKGLKKSKTVGRDEAKTAFILGLIGLIGLLIPGLILASIPLAIIAIIKGNRVLRTDPYNRKARAAVTLGNITIAILLFAMGLLLLIFALGPIGPR